MKSLLLVVLLVLVCCYATNADPLEFLYPLNKARRVLPRLTFTFKLAPSTFQPFNLDYWQGIGVLSLLGIFITIVLVLFMFIFPKVRRCGLCGGMEPSTGFCFIGTPKTKPYPIWFRVITLFVVAFVLFLIL
jgi:RsiW-degrading membrane proteinase PrsW (M82 family)